MALRVAYSGRCSRTSLESTWYTTTAATIIATSTPKAKSLPVEVWFTQWSISRRGSPPRVGLDVGRQQRLEPPDRLGHRFRRGP